MFQHTLLLAFRSFIRFKSTFFINLIGLSTGLACALFIYLWVNDELHVDKFHEKDKRLFQVMEQRQAANGIFINDKTAGLTGETLRQEMPEVEFTTSVMHYSNFPKAILAPQENHKIKATGQFASPDFFRVFSYGLIAGDERKVLQDKSAIVLSDELALRLYHSTQNVVGKTLIWQMGPLKQQLQVSGIFKKVPANSSEQFDFLMSFEAWKEVDPSVLKWENDGTHTYVVLKEGTNAIPFNQKIAHLLETKIADTHRKLFLKPYSEKYLYGNYENGVVSGGRIEYVHLFSVIAVFILLIACINFMNLSTAKATRRIKEVGVKKVMGASRSILILQYLGESLLMAFISLAGALVLVIFLLPAFNQITGKQLTLPINPVLLATVLGITGVTGLIAGSYPALYLAGFSPATILKGKLPRSVSELLVRKGLVVFQFSLSVILIVAVLVVYKQIEYIQTKHLGFDKDNIIYFVKEGKLYDRQDAFLAEVKNIPGVVNASSIGRSFIGSHNTTGGLFWPGKDPQANIAFEVIRVNYDMIQTLGIQMAAGRPFSRDFAADDKKIIFNEAAIAAMGLQDPVGKKINMWGNDLEIVGVTKNFHFESLHENIKPLLFILEPPQTHAIMVKIGAGKTKEVIRQLDNLYKKFNPGFPLDYQFLDADYQAQYTAETRVAALSNYFAVLAILISCLGLFGLAAFTADEAAHEVRSGRGFSAVNKDLEKWLK